MKRKETDRGTRVLACGLTPSSFYFWKSGVESGLKGAHMGWSLLADVRISTKAAVDYVKECDDLEVVHFPHNCLHPFSADGLPIDPKAIARALAEHPHKPWVHLDLEVQHLRPVFEAQGLTVRIGMLEEVIFGRWESQLDRAAA